MQVRMYVAFDVEVPDDTDIDTLCLGIDTDNITVEDTQGDVIEDSSVDGYTTESVEPANPDYAAECDE